MSFEKDGCEILCIVSVTKNDTLSQCFQINNMGTLEKIYQKQKRFIIQLEEELSSLHQRLITFVSKRIVRTENDTGVSNLERTYHEISQQKSLPPPQLKMDFEPTISHYQLN
jgi:hypothetical protein